MVGDDVNGPLVGAGDGAAENDFPVGRTVGNALGLAIGCCEGDCVGEIVGGLVMGTQSADEVLLSG